MQYVHENNAGNDGFAYNLARRGAEVLNFLAFWIIQKHVFRCTQNKTFVLQMLFID